MPQDVFNQLGQFFAELGYIVWNFIEPVWPILAFAILLPLAYSAWFAWRKFIYKKNIRYILLEIKMPREIKKNPKAMEQVFTAVHSLRNAPGTWLEKWWDGEVTRPYSFELVTFGGETHFYIRLYYKQKSLMEAAFLSYYPDLELVEVDDYVSRLPGNIDELQKQGYDLWGTEVILARESAYPIKAYEKFESPDEDKQYDTMSSYFELFSSLKKEEIICFQIIIAPKGHEWAERWQGLLQKLNERKSEAKEKLTTDVSFPGGFPGPLPKFDIKRAGEDDNTLFRTAFRTPGETDILKAVGNNLSKPAFDTLIRFVYLSPKTMYMDSIPRRGIRGILNQFTAIDLNSFDFNNPTAVGTGRVLLFHFPHVFPTKRSLSRKAKNLYNYINRVIPEENFIGRLITSRFFSWSFPSKRFEMNTECLATIFHPPTVLSLTAPHIERVESKKGGPPAGLAIFGSEESIEGLK
ncbi:MAG: hypothetical protein HY432_03615 [Candidatus Liptonbacteria bacterium]|nr:hypothetical protein [Candidatus Liptonbacteria bacterium]